MNVISAISVAGVALASMALICTLSVFNGFNDLVESLFTDFDPQLKIVSADGKTFRQDDRCVANVQSLPYVAAVSMSLESQALLRYKDVQTVVTVKGVDDSFHEVCSIENILFGQGVWMLHDDVCDYGVMGIGLMKGLNCGVQSAYPFTLYAPKRGAKISLAVPESSLNSVRFYSPGVVFQVNQQPYDDSYLIVSLDLARRLNGYDNEVSALDIKLAEGTSLKHARKEIQSVIGPGKKVLDRYEQQEDILKVIRLEKFISYLFLSFILLVALFNIIGSLVMLMVEKKDDARVLENLGMEPLAAGRIFVYDGLLISVLGALAGLALGVVLALLQQWLGFIPLGTDGGFVVDAYPVSVHLADVLLVLVTVVAASALSLWPVSRIAGRFMKDESADSTDSVIKD